MHRLWIAVILFDGTDLDGWESVNEGANPWEIIDGAMVVSKRAKGADGKDIGGSIRTKQGFGDIQLHLEFPHALRGQGRGTGTR